MPPSDKIDELRMRSLPALPNFLILSREAQALFRGDPNYFTTEYTRVVYAKGYSPTYFIIPRYYGTKEEGPRDDDESNRRPDGPPQMNQENILKDDEQEM